MLAGSPAHRHRVPATDYQSNDAWPPVYIYDGGLHFVDIYLVASGKPAPWPRADCSIDRSNRLGIMAPWVVVSARIANRGSGIGGPLEVNFLVWRMLGRRSFSWLRPDRPSVAVPLPSVHHLIEVFGDFHVDRELVAELLPSGGDPVSSWLLPQ